MKTVALFGGSFDPPHIGHIALVKELVKLPYIDEIIVMPTYLSPFKSQSYAPSELRIKWLKDIFKNMQKVFVSDYEVNLKRKVATIESVEHIIPLYTKIFVVIGADNLQTLSQWQAYDTLQRKVQFIVASRDDIPVTEEFIHLKIDEKVSSSQLRHDIKIHSLPPMCAKEIIQFYKEKNER